MEDFDLLYMMKTPFYMGNYAKVQDEASQVEINPDDQRALAMKNLLLVRALTAKNDFV